MHVCMRWEVSSGSFGAGGLFRIVAVHFANAGFDPSPNQSLRFLRRGFLV